MCKEKQCPQVLTPEQLKLVEDNMGFAHYMAVRLKGRTPLVYEDLLAACSEGLCKAALRYEPDTGYSFTTFASVVIKNTVFMENRQCRKNGDTVYLETLLGEDSLNWEAAISDRGRPLEDVVISGIDLHAALTKTVPRLNRTEQNVLFAAMTNPYATQRHLADILGFKQSYISRVLKSIRIKLQAELCIRL